jgi:hypothetical protein
MAAQSGYIELDQISETFNTMYPKRRHKSYFSGGRLAEATRLLNWRVSNPPYNIKS